MEKIQISIIAAIGSNRELGKDNKLIWHIPEDMKRFKELTSGHVVIMGRKTYESIGRPLPNRINLVITQNKSFQAPGCIVVNSLEDALNIAKDKEKKEIFIIGGGQIYQQAINLADKLYLTIVEGKFDADTYFPDYSRYKNVVTQTQGSSGDYRYTFLELKP